MDLKKNHLKYNSCGKLENAHIWTNTRVLVTKKEKSRTHTKNNTQHSGGMLLTQGQVINTGEGCFSLTLSQTFGQCTSLLKVLLQPQTHVLFCFCLSVCFSPEKGQILAETSRHKHMLYWFFYLSFYFILFLFHFFINK